MNQTSKPNLRERLRRIFRASLLTILGGAVLTFGVDLGVFHLRLVTNRGPYGSVTVNHYYAVAQKNGKTEFIFDPPQAETCIHALFPHSGYPPCWYLTRHPEPRTDI